jgi:hypothetical protein
MVWHFVHGIGKAMTTLTLACVLAGTDAVFTLKVFSVQFSLYSHLQVLD